MRRSLIVHFDKAPGLLPPAWAQLLTSSLVLRPGLWNRVPEYRLVLSETCDTVLSGVRFAPWFSFCFHFFHPAFHTLRASPTGRPSLPRRPRGEEAIVLKQLHIHREDDRSAPSEQRPDTVFGIAGFKRHATRLKQAVLTVPTETETSKILPGQCDAWPMAGICRALLRYTSQEQFIWYCTVVNKDTKRLSQQ